MADSMAFRLLVVVAICGMSGVISVLGQSSNSEIAVEPTEATVLPGDSVSFMCSVPYKFKNCRVGINGYENNFIVGDITKRAEISYKGNGTENGQCGFTINKVEEKNNGIVTCLIQNKEDSMDISGKMNLIVARSPDGPVFRSPIRQSYNENEELKMQCAIANGRPVAKMQWYLDDELLSDGLHSTSVKIEPGSQLQTITQNLTRRLSVNDLGRTLTCVAIHKAWRGNNKTISTKLDVKFAPKPIEGPIEIFGIKIGETGIIYVTVRANPRPSFEWLINDKHISQDSAEYDQGRYTPQMLETGNGFFNISLIIASVTREDTESNFLLKVYNLEGSQEYRVRISTLDEPQGVDIGIGAIIGIIIGVLVILIIIILVIFAKATNRWCFGDDASANPKKTKIAGESSDTESTGVDSGHHGKSKAKPKENPETEAKESKPLTKALAFPKSINLKSLLPGGAKNKDKVAQMETGAEQLESKMEEETKPLQSKAENQEPAELVYAELSLKPSENQEDKPAQDRTEYAEIVYNNQPIENKMEATKPEK